jgi:hypothetical protein
MEQFPFNNASGFWNEPDYLLGLLVSFLGNKVGAEFGITLMVHGSVITGTLVSERVYMERLSDLMQTLMRSAVTNPTPEDIALMEEVFAFEELLEDDYLDRDELDDDAPDEDEDEDLLDEMPPPIRHLHIRDPYILYPGSAMTFSESPMPIMRVRLAAVDGWLPGRVNVIDPMDDDFNPPFPNHRFKQ